MLPTPYDAIEVCEEGLRRLAIQRACAELAAWIRAHPGQEICGFLACEASGTARFVILQNTASLPMQCEVTGGEWSRVIAALEQRGWTPLAFLHSHLGAAIPSELDRLQAQGGPLPWVIVSAATDGQEYGAYAQLRHRSGDFRFYPARTIEECLQACRFYPGSRPLKE